ncbi:MAG: dTDP-4-dehydrorhamnose reductase [Dethiobacter sp.]|jgi:dTDP-4-dehydrorhamnose reductase|nr:dTDP-4-dehydrorhamnose reductase [Dethiobacter sp.]
MKILITGGNGNLAGALVKKLESSYQLQALAHHDLDITVQEEVVKKISTFKPHFVINTAAITDVDGCENQIKKALDVNGLGPNYLAKACRENDSILVHFSTEMIFDGLKTTPYVETDCPNPLLAYGLTKYIGEQNIKKTGCKYTILRTSWLFGGGVPKFVNNFISKANQAHSIKVVKNQTGSPTYIYDIAAAIDLYLQEPKLGIYHLANSGEASRLDMAQFIKKELSLDCELVPVFYQDLGIKTYRPAHAALDSLYKKKHPFLQLRPWQEALREYLGLTE